MEFKFGAMRYAYCTLPQLAMDYASGSKSKIAALLRDQELLEICHEN
jgi:hypothetical protein